MIRRVVTRTARILRALAVATGTALEALLVVGALLYLRAVLSPNFETRAMMTAALSVTLLSVFAMSVLATGMILAAALFPGVRSLWAYRAARRIARARLSLLCPLVLYFFVDILGVVTVGYLMVSSALMWPATSPARHGGSSASSLLRLGHVRE